MKPDEQPWVTIAKAVLFGAYDQADSSTVKALCIGLTGIDHEQCRAALKKLQEVKSKKRKDEQEAELI